MCIDVVELEDTYTLFAYSLGLLKGPPADYEDADRRSDLALRLIAVSSRGHLQAVLAISEIHLCIDSADDIEDSQDGQIESATTNPLDGTRHLSPRPVDWTGLPGSTARYRP